MSVPLNRWADTRSLIRSSKPPQQRIPAGRNDAEKTIQRHLDFSTANQEPLMVNLWGLNKNSDYRKDQQRQDLLQLVLGKKGANAGKIKSLVVGDGDLAMGYKAEGKWNKLETLYCVIFDPDNFLDVATPNAIFPCLTNLFLMHCE